MRIGFLSERYPGLFGAPPEGPTRYTWTAATGLAGRGHDVHVLAVVENPPDLEPRCMDGVWVHPVPYAHVPYLEHLAPGVWNAWKLRRACSRLHRTQPFDVFESVNSEGLGVFLPGLLGERTFMRMHTAFLQHVRLKNQPMNRKRRFIHRMDRAAVRKTPHLLTHSQANADEMRKVYELSADRKIHVIPIGTILPDLSSCAHSAANSGPAILTVGLLELRKGTDILFRILPTLFQKLPGAVITFIGQDTPSAPDGGTWQAYADKTFPSELRARIHFKGRLMEEPLNKHYAACDIYLSPTRYESFGLTLIEAMAHAKPVVSHRTGSVPEVVADGETGFLPEVGDEDGLLQALVRLGEDATLREHMGNAARLRVEKHFTRDVMAERMETLFDEIVKSGGHHG